MSEERERYEVSGAEHAADGARTAKRSASAPKGTSPPAPPQRAHFWKLLYRMRKVALEASKDGMSNREYWVRTEMWQIADEMEDEFMALAIREQLALIALDQAASDNKRYLERIRELTDKVNEFYRQRNQARKDLRQAWEDYQKLEEYTKATMILDVTSAGPFHIAVEHSGDADGAFENLESWQRERLQRG